MCACTMEMIDEVEQAGVSMLALLSIYTKRVYSNESTCLYSKKRGAVSAQSAQYMRSICTVSVVYAQ